MPSGMATALALATALAAVLLVVACSRPASLDEATNPQSDEPEVATMNEVTPSSSLTAKELLELVEDLPQPSQVAIQANPQQFVELIHEVMDQSEELVWIVDKERAIAAAYEPADLVDLDAYADKLVLGRPDHRVRGMVIPDLIAMAEEANADSVVLEISSTYRSFEYQSQVYQRWVTELGQEEADRTSAQPGHSQHQLGTTIDFGCICDQFADSDAGVWMKENAWRFGFSMSYPEGSEDETGYAYESWHFRYIGKPAAELSQYYFSGMQHLTLEFIDSHRDQLVSARRQS